MIRKLKRAFLLLAAVFAVGSVKASVQNNPRTITTNEYDVASVPDVVPLHDVGFRAWLNDSNYLNYKAYGGSGEQDYPTKDSALVIKITDGSNSQIFDNLYPGRSYDWSVGGQSGSFKVESQAPRTLNTPDIVGSSALRYSGRNVRDLGGWKLIGTNKRTNFDKIFRSANWDGWIDYEGSQTCSMHEFAKTEIDLRGKSGGHNNFSGGKSPSDPLVDFYSFTVSYTWNASVTDLINTFKILGNADNYPVVFHCTAGKDRTGMVAYYIEALCGMYEADLYRDFMATTFSGWGVPEIISKQGGIDYYSRMLRANADKRHGESLAGLTRAYLEDIGVASNELEVITMALTGETLDEVLDRVKVVPLSDQVTPPAGDPEDDPGDDPDDDPDDDPTGGDELDPSTMRATGGYAHWIKENDIYYWVHEFSNTTEAVQFVNTSGADLPVEYLVVGGGGAGGDGYSSGKLAGGGGGGGGVVYVTDAWLPAEGRWSITVGKGGSAEEVVLAGARVEAEASEIKDSNSEEVIAHALGGGAGACAKTQVATGGASGGGAANASATAGKAIMHQDKYQGHDGGGKINNGGAGGGGGADSVGGDGDAEKSGNGGNGICYTITGKEVFYGCGGGGSAAPYYDVAAGLGGSEGKSGGDGGVGYARAEDGVDGTGCGGGGGVVKDDSGTTTKVGNAANGGDGIVVIRYAVSATPPTPASYTVTFVTNNNVTVKTLANKSSGYVIKSSDVPSSLPYGSWDENPVGWTVTANKTFTYTVAKMWTVTFSWDDVRVDEETTQVADGETLANVPTFMGGSWDVNPAGAVIICDTNFNYTTTDTPVDPVDPVGPGGQRAVGGTVTQIDQDGKHYYVHTFTDTTSAQEFTNTSGADLEVEYLVVGGGGAGGNSKNKNDESSWGAGGGGGGAVKEGFRSIAAQDSWIVMVGAGGIASSGQSAGVSSIGVDDKIIVESMGGGAGGACYADGSEGAAGGGAGGGKTSIASGKCQSIIRGESYGPFSGGKGGKAVVISGKPAENSLAGGGGGAGGNGCDGVGDATLKSGNGGDGLASSIAGTSVRYGAGGGGGGGARNQRKDGPFVNGATGIGVIPGNGGLGGGGNGGDLSNAPSAGIDGTGAGGGGAGGQGGTGGEIVYGANGGSGIVIIRYEGVSVPEFEVTFSSNNVQIAEYTVNVISNGHLAASEIPAWAGAKWDVSPYGATIVCATNFNCVVEEIVVHEMPFSVLGADSGSVISFTGSYTGVMIDDKAYVTAGTTATLGAIDVTGKTYCGCWRDDSTGELFWGETVTVSPTKDTTYTACFGPMWSLYKDELYDRVAANHYYHLNNGIWDFKVTFNESTREITVNKLLNCATDPVGGIVNWTTPIMDADGVTNGNKIVSFSNYDNTNQGYAEIFEKSDDTSRPSWNHHSLPTMIFLPETTEEVDVMALRYLNNMTGVLCIPKNVKLYHQAFAYATNLEGLLFKGGVDGGQTFEGRTYYIMKDGKREAHYSDGNQFETSPNIRGSIVLPRTITVLPKNCFHSDKSIQEIDLTYVTEIGDRALFDCHSLTNAINLEAVTAVLFQGCDGCWNLSGDVTFTNLVVGNFNAFANCGFTSVKLPKATEFHYGVFANDVKLTNIVFSQWRQVVFAHNVEDDHPQWPYTESSQRGCYCTNNLPCWLTFPGPAPVFGNMAHRATCSILFGEHDVASGRQPEIEPKELCLEANWDYDPDGWQKIYDEIGDPMPYNSARPIQSVPANLDVRGTINWMYKYNHTEFKKTYSDDPIENARLKSQHGYEDLENNKAKAFLICRPQGLYFFVK